MKILTFDIESCTGNPLDGSLCSFGYVLTENGRILQSGDILCNPLPERFSLGGFGKSTGLKLAYPVAHFRKQPRFEGRYCEIKALFDSADLVLGFAVQNDLRYLNNACDSFSLPRFSFRFLDVQLLGGLVLPEHRNHGLKAFAEYFDISFIEHRSDEDARVTHEIYGRLLELSESTVEELVEEYGITYGVNSEEGHRSCYSELIVAERLAANSRATRKLLVNYYANAAQGLVERRGNALKGMSVAIAESVYAKEVGTARRIAVTVAAENGEYDSSILSCRLFVVAEGDKLGAKVKHLNRTCSVVTVEQFKSICGELADYPFDDMQIMRDHYYTLCTDRA